MADRINTSSPQLDYLSRSDSDAPLQVARLLSRVALLTLTITCFGPAFLRLFLPTIDLSVQDILNWSATAAGCVMILAAVGMVFQRNSASDIRPASQYGTAHLVVYSFTLILLQVGILVVCQFCEPFCQAYFIKLYGPCARWYEGTRILRSELGGGAFSLFVALLSASNFLLTVRRAWRDRDSSGAEFRSCIALPAAWLTVLGEMMLLSKYGIVQTAE